MTQYFNTKEVQIGTYVPIVGDATFSEIEAEPQLHKASTAFALEYGGPLTQGSLDVLRDELREEEFKDLSIDTKVHMLHKGWFPCIGGWHGDFVHRVDSNIQPDEERDKGVRHFLLVSGDPYTQFIYRRNVQTNLETPHWGDISKIVADTIPETEYFAIPKATMVEFASNELHRGVASDVDGFVWRYLFRATLFPKDHPSYNSDLTGKVRMQQQVYIDTQAGW